MAFSHDSSTSEGLLRTLIQDVDSTNYIFEDAELTSVLDLNSDDLWRSAADCCRALAAKYAAEAIDLTLGKGDIKIDKRKKSEHYFKLARTYDNRSGSDVVEYIDSLAYGVNVYGQDISEYVGDDG